MRCWCGEIEWLDGIAGPSRGRVRIGLRTHGFQGCYQRDLWGQSPLARGSRLPSEWSLREPMNTTKPYTTPQTYTDAPGKKDQKVCGDCGSIVARATRYRHDDWHRRMEQK